jgi:hypothetical protein
MLLMFYISSVFWIHLVFLRQGIKDRSELNIGKYLWIVPFANLVLLAMWFISKQVCLLSVKLNK